MRTEQGRHSARPGKCRARAAGERTPTNPNKQWKSTREWSSHNENMGHLYLSLLFPRHRCTVLTHHNVTVLYSADSLFVTQPSSPLTRKSTSPPGRPTSDASAERRIILNYHRTALTSVEPIQLKASWALGAGHCRVSEKYSETYQVLRDPILWVPVIQNPHPSLPPSLFHQRNYTIPSRNPLFLLLIITCLDKSPARFHHFLPDTLVPAASTPFVSSCSSTLALASY